MTLKIENTIHLLISAHHAHEDLIELLENGVEVHRLNKAIGMNVAGWVNHRLLTRKLNKIKAGLNVDFKLLKQNSKRLPAEEMREALREWGDWIVKYREDMITILDEHHNNGCKASGEEFYLAYTFGGQGVL